MIELDNIEAAKRMVERGLGVALLPGTAVADAIDARPLAELELIGRPADPVVGCLPVRHHRPGVGFGDVSMTDPRNLEGQHQLGAGGRAGGRSTAPVRGTPPAAGGSDRSPRSGRRRFQSIATETLSGRISRQLIGDILRGEFVAGQEIPAEDQLAEEFGVSRPVVREAVKHLSVLGLVQSRQGRQTRVAPYEAWNHFAPEILAARREAGAVEDVLLELLELRRMIELEAAALAATRATAQDIEAMQAALSILDRSLDDPAEFTQGDIAFHDAILRATRNHLVPRLFDLLRPLLEFGREISVSTRPQGPTVSQAGHRAIFEAIRNGSPAEARKAMEEHLSWTANLQLSEREVRLALERAQRDGEATSRGG